MIEDNLDFPIRGSSKTIIFPILFALALFFLMLSIAVFLERDIPLIGGIVDSFVESFGKNITAGFLLFMAYSELMTILIFSRSIRKHTKVVSFVLYPDVVEITPFGKFGLAGDKNHKETISVKEYRAVTVSSAQGHSQGFISVGLEHSDPLKNIIIKRFNNSEAAENFAAQLGKSLRLQVQTAG